MKEETVKFFRGERGEFSITTTAKTPDEFLAECAVLMEGMEAGERAVALPQMFDITAKLKGYKADGVEEYRVLYTGTRNAEAALALMPRREPRPERG